MAIGCNATANEENIGNPLNVPAASQLVNIPRPFNSPRPRPCKRPLEVDDFNLSPSQRALHEVECTPAKQRKLTTELCRNVSILEQVLPKAAETKSDEPAKIAPAAMQLPSLRGPRPNRSLNEAVEKAMKLHCEALIAYILEKDLKDEEKADLLAETWAAEHYEELKSAIMDLLPWAGEVSQTKSGSYEQISFKGIKTKTDEIDKIQLEHFRREGETARAWEALCALFSTISNRKEKNWLEQIDVEDELKQMLRKLPNCKSKKSIRRQKAIREMVPKIIEDGGAGAFSPYLIDPRSLHSFTLTRGVSGTIPATHMTTRRMPLWNALKTMDDDGPLRGDAMEKEWCFAPGRQFVLQDLQFGYKDTSRKARQYAAHLEPDSELRDLLRSNKPVVLLDTLAALAPREICRNNGISKIVQAELVKLLQEAKANGEAVVFSLGSEDPHKLAEKVYLRPPLGNWGMRVGCLRWRASAKKPWAREFQWDDRITLCLQMP